jgi:hypothetical protein
LHTPAFSANSKEQDLYHRHRRCHREGAD